MNLAKSGNKRDNLIFFNPPEDWAITHELSSIRNQEAEEAAREYETSDLVIFNSTQIYFHSDKTTTYTYQNFRQILSLEGLQNLSEYPIEFMPFHQEIIIHTILIHRNGAIINKTKESHYRTENTSREHMGEINSGYGRVTIIVKDLKIGDILEFQYSICGSNPTLSGHYATTLNIGFYHPSLRVYFKMNAPKDKAFSFKNHGTQLTPTISQYTDDTSRVNYVYDFNPILLKNHEEDLPSGHYQAPFIEISDMKSWGELYSLLQDSYKLPETLPSALLNILEDIKNAHLSISDKATACIDFVQKRIRYQTCSEPLFAIRPFSIEEIIDNGFGDCKNKSLLLITMFNYFNIESYAALVNSRSPFEPANFLPKSSAFDHVIVTYCIDKEQYWIDATETYQSGKAELRYISNKGYAFIMKETSNCLTLIPEDQRSKIITYEQFDFSQSPENSVKLMIKEVRSGKHATSMREFLERNTKKDISKRFIDTQKKTHSEIEHDGDPEFYDDPETGIITSIENYLMPLSSIEKQDDELYLRSYPIRSYFDYPKDYESRKHPYALIHPVCIEHEIKLIFPRPIYLKTLDTTDIIMDEAFELIHSNKEIGNQHIFNYKYKNLSRYVDQDKLHSYVENLDKASRITWVSIPLCLFDKKWLDKHHPTQQWRKIWNKISDFVGDWFIYCVLGTLALKIINYLLR